MTKKQKWIWISGGVLALLVLSTVANAFNPQDRGAKNAAPTIAVSVPATPTVTSTPPMTSAPVVNDMAERTNSALLNNYAVNSFSELLSTDAGSMTGLISKIESPTPGTVVITVQIDKNSTTKAELKDTARAIHSLVGMQITDLDRVEVVTADFLLRGVSNRRDIPLLNQ